jgi:acetylornithine deacetylase
VERQKQSYPSVETSLRIATIDAGYELPEKGLVIDLLKAAYARNNLPWDPVPFISHSDANRLWRSGVKPVLMGPGSLSKAHAPDESVRFEQVLFAAELYLDLLRSTEFST